MLAGCWRAHLTGCGSSEGEPWVLSPRTAGHVLSTLEQGPTLSEHSVLRQWLMACAAHYLGKELSGDRPVDPVARLHLGNAARVGQIHGSADLAAKGFKQSFGLMVNCLYDLRKINRHRQGLSQGKVIA